ncbi:MAG: T9SS type A sorting domain-containing protein [Bacteroidetes bacterium]|nr:T9SS type A sorting domain-containing protein [Bacteroidota bacterium]
MRNLLLPLFTLSVLATSAQSNSYLPLNDSTQIWYSSYCQCGLGGGTRVTKTYHFGADTVIGSFTYLKAKATEGYDEYIRQDTSGRYYLYATDREYLLYDFNAVAGDSFTVDPISHNYYKVDSTDAVLIDGSLRKRVWCKTNYGLPQAPQGAIVPIQWVEGVGSSMGLISVFERSAGFVYSYCGVQKEGRKIYPDTVGKCDITTGVIDLASQDLQISPIPATDVVAVSADSWMFDKIELINMQGQVLYTEIASHQLSLRSYSPGIYLLRMSDKEGNYTFRNIVKE